MLLNAKCECHAFISGAEYHKHDHARRVYIGAIQVHFSFLEKQGFLDCQRKKLLRQGPIGSHFFLLFFVVWTKVGVSKGALKKNSASQKQKKNCLQK
jgi:hypothetical protein